MTQNNTTILKKLFKIQVAVRGLKNNKMVNAGASYSFLTSEKLIGAIRPLMDKNGIILKQEVLKIEHTRLDYTTSQNKPKTEVLYTVYMKFTWVDTDTGEIEECSFAAVGKNDFTNGLSAALTSGERLFLLKYFHIATDEDDYDEYDESEEKPSPATNTTPTQKTITPNPPAKTVTPPPVNMPQLPELTIDKEEAWNKVVTYLASGGKIEEVRTKWVVTKPNEELLKKKALERVA